MKNVSEITVKLKNKPSGTILDIKERVKDMVQKKEKEHSEVSNLIDKNTVGNLCNRVMGILETKILDCNFDAD